EVRFQDAPNWEVLVFAIAQVQLECPDLQLMLKSYQVTGKQYVLRLSVNRLVNTKLLSQRILELYPELLRRFAAQRQSILKLLKIGEKPDSPKKLSGPSPIASPASGSIAARRQQNYRAILNQIQKIILSQPPELLVKNVQPRLKFLQQQNLLTEEIQKKVISQAMIERAKTDELFINQLLQWEKTASEAARFSLLGQAVRLAIALLQPDADLTE
ncbi:MAG TPA: low-complexity protein, partial [Allocoleopsis sp.]